MGEEISKFYNQLPPWVQQSPAIVLLLAIIIGLMSGYLVTGRTFDRETARCQTDAALYKAREDQILKNMADAIKENTIELRTRRRDDKQ